MIIILFFLVTWYVGLFFQTFFLHRYAAHGMFKMSRTTEKVFFVLTWIFQGSNYLSAYGYGVMHRLHHNHADTEEDPHSPSFSKTLMHMMWDTRVFYNDIMSGKFKVEPRIARGVPRWDSFDNFANGAVSRLMWIGIYIAIFYFFVTAPWQWVLLPIVCAMAPVHGAIINWFAHKYGYRNYEVEDTSTNFLPFDFLMMGESYHNNHHVRATDPNFGGNRWHEIDPTWQITKVLLKLGVVKLASTEPISVEVGHPSWVGADDPEPEAQVEKELVTVL